jgi:catechol 2,3-dioxygenase-like lactoylglutathione lyase family enzyme
MAGSPVALIEFPADDADRARRFWSGLLGIGLESRTAAEGEGWQTRRPARRSESTLAGVVPGTRSRCPTSR